MDRQPITREDANPTRNRFLLAKLHLDSLSDKVCKGDVKRALKSLPTGSDAYDRVYDESLVRIQSQTENLKHLAMRALMWTICSKGPLNVDGLQQALAITSTTKTLDVDNIPDIDLVIEVCSGLINFDEKSKVIRLVHFTAQEYLQRKWKQWFTGAHSEIAWVCVFYLSLGKSKAGKGSDVPNSQSSSFHHYASTNWKYHAQFNPTEDIFTLRLLVDPFIVAYWNKTTIPRCHCGNGSSSSCFTAPTNASPLHFAVHHGTETSVKLLLQNGSDCHKKDKYQRTPLSWAVERSVVPTTLALLDAGANVNHVDMFGGTPLSYAAVMGSPEIVKLLLQRGAKVDRKCHAGETPFDRACARGKSKSRDAIIGIFLAHDAALVAKSMSLVVDFEEMTELARLHKRQDFAREIEKRSSKFQSASLLASSRNGNLGDVKRLLREGANPDYRDPPWGRSPLSQAAEYNRTAVVTHLLESGVHPDMLDTNGFANSQRNAGRTPLMWAISNGHVHPFRELLKHGADPEKGGHSKNKGGALHWATELGRTEMVRILLEKDPQINARDSQHLRTPLTWAAEKGHLQPVKLLLSHGADPKVPDKHARQPLTRAAKNGYLEIAKLLIEAGADILAKDQHGWTPLHAAAYSGHLNICKFLVEKGAEINNGNKDQWTPLHEAAHRGHIHVSKFLLEHHAKPELVDNRGRSPIYLAEAKGHLELAKVLRKHGIDHKSAVDVAK